MKFHLARFGGSEVGILDSNVMFLRFSEEWGRARGKRLESAWRTLGKHEECARIARGVPPLANVFSLTFASRLPSLA